MTIRKRLATSAVAIAFAASLGSGAAPVNAASNGDVVIGTTATNGHIYVGTATANSGAVLLAAGTGDIYVGTATSDPDSGGQVSGVLDQNAPPTIRD